MEPCIRIHVARNGRDYARWADMALSTPNTYAILDPDKRSRLLELLTSTDLPPAVISDEPDSPVGPRRRPQAEHVVLALSPGEWRGPARYFAAARNATLVDVTEEPGRAIDRALAEYRPEYLTLVGHPHQFGAGLLLRLMDIQSRTEAPALGILTHRSPSRLSELVFKNLLYQDCTIPGTSLAFIGVTDTDMQYDDGGSRVLGKPLSTGRELAAVSPRPLRILAVLNHGRPDIVNLVDAKICGRCTDPGPKDVGGSGFFGYPACHYTDQCHVPSSLIGADQVPAAFTLINSCFSLGLSSSLIDLNYSFIMALLDGLTAACLSSPVMREGKCTETAMILAALRDGLSTGAAARLGARVLCDTGLDHPSLLLIGDPTLCLYPRAPGPAAGRLGQKDGVISIRGPQRTSNLLETTIPHMSADQLNGGAWRPYLKDSPRTRQPLFWSAISDPAGTRLLVSSWTPTDWSHLDVELRPSPLTIHDYGERVHATHSALSLHGFMGINVPRAASRLQRANEAMSNLASLYDQGLFDLRQHGLIRKREHALSGLLNELERDALLFLLGRTDRRVFHFPDAYRHLCELVDSTSTGDPCPQCGGIALTCRLRHRLRPDFNRQWVMCVRCGVVSDYPVSAGKGHPRLRMSLDGPAQLAVNGRWHGILTLSNDQQRPVDVAAGVRMIGGSWHDTSYHPEWAAVTVPPGETELPVTISPAQPSPSPHHRWLRAYAVSWGQIYSINRDIFFVPEGSEGRCQTS